MSFLTPLYILGLLGRRGADRVPPDPPLAQGRGAVQLADVPVADAAAPDAAQPAGPLAPAPAAGGRALPAGVCVCPAVPPPGGPAGLRRRSSSGGSPC